MMLMRQEPCMITLSIQINFIERCRMNRKMTLSRYELNKFERDNHLPESNYRCLLLAEALSTTRMEFYLQAAPGISIKVLKSDVRRLFFGGSLIRISKVIDPLSAYIDFDASRNWSSYLIRKPNDLLNQEYHLMLTQQTLQMLSFTRHA